MLGLLTTLFVILCVVLAGIILLQQGKGDLGLGSLGNGGQMLFGGSGGQEFFERLTWGLGFVFIVGALGLAVARSTYSGSRIKNYQAPVKIKTQAPAAQEKTSDVAHEAAPEAAAE